MFHVTQTKTKENKQTNRSNNIDDRKINPIYRKYLQQKLRSIVMLKHFMSIYFIYPISFCWNQKCKNPIILQK